MKINNLLKKQDSIAELWKTEYLNIIKRNILKYGVANSQEKISEELKTKMPKHVKECLQLGVDFNG